MSVTFTACHPDAVESVNVTNVNAGTLLDVLQFAGDPWDAEPADAADFLARIALAEALEPPDDGVPPSEEEPGLLLGIPVARLVDCGRRPGYVQEKLAELRAVGEEALRFGVAVSWC